jgi:hypothetical protein
MSGNPDDLLDEASEEEFDNFQNARIAVLMPATLLVLVGALSLVSALFELIQLDSVPGKMDQQMEEVKANKDLTDDERDQWIDIFAAIKESAEQKTLLIVYIINIGSAIVIVVGGRKMMRLSGLALPSISSVLAMVPCTIGCCCLLGIPVGIWSLVVLSRPSVRTVIEGRSSAGEYSQDQDAR